MEYMRKKLLRITASQAIVRLMENYNIYLAQLPDQKQKHVRQCLKTLRIFLRKAGSRRLTLYESENAKADTCTVFKTITDLKEAIAVIEGMIRELVEGPWTAGRRLLSR